MSTEFDSTHAALRSIHEAETAAMARDRDLWKEKAETYAGESAAAVTRLAMAEQTIRELRDKYEKPGDTPPPPPPDPAADERAPLNLTPTLTLGNGDVLPARVTEPGTRIWIRPGESVGFADATLDVLADDVVVYSDPRNPGTLLHPGGAHDVVMVKAARHRAVLDGLRLAVAAPAGRNAYALDDVGTDTRLTRCAVAGQNLTRIANAGQGAPCVRPLYEHVRTEGVLGGAYDPGKTSVVGFMLNPGTADATVRSNRVSATEYAVRHGAGSARITDNEWVEADAKVYRSGAATLRPTDPAAVVEYLRNVHRGGILEVGYDTAPSVWLLMRIEDVLLDGCEFVQVCGADNGGEIQVRRLSVKNWRGPSGLIDVRKSPRCTIDVVTVEAGSKPTSMFYQGRQLLPVTNATKGGVPLL